jgi:hypothetical protein
MRKRLRDLFGVLAAAACVFGVVIATPTAVPVASAAPIGNGYDVTCTKANDGQVVCNIAGCPKVYEDLVGDVIHIQLNHDRASEEELPKSCNNVTTKTYNVDANKPINVNVQGCRKTTIGSDDCGAWADYNYTPPAPKKVGCPPGSVLNEVDEGQQCQAAPPKTCPLGSKTETVPAGQECEAAPEKNCPPGSAANTVPAGQNCEGPKNAVSMTITQEGLNANVAVTNNSALPADCAYTATRTGGLLGPASVSRNVSVGPNATGNITDLLWPPPLVSYRATVNCKATYDGKQVSIGESTQNVSG